MSEKLHSTPGRADLLVETSAIAAILLREPDGDALAERVGEARCVTTAVNVFEAVLALSKAKSATPGASFEAVKEFLRAAQIEVLPFGPEMLPHAVAARERYGHGRKGLNMGDCLSYAAAKQLGLTLLYKGDDFAGTDVNS